MPDPSPAARHDDGEPRDGAPGVGAPDEELTADETLDTAPENDGHGAGRTAGGSVEGDRPPADAHERRRITEIRSRNLFVDAGAGTGKTKSLVDRVEALVLDDEIAMESIAAITFTEKAAIELQNRIRQRFEMRLEGSSPDKEDTSDSRKAHLARTALDQLDSAAVGTLHSFAQRILSEHLVAAELPPGIEVLDEIGSQIDFESRWGEFLDNLLERPEARRSLLMLDAVKVKPEQLRKLALQMAANWDLVEEQLDLDPPKPQPFDPAPLIAEFDRVLALRRECEALGNETLLPYFDKLASNRRRLDGAFDDNEALALAADMGNKGSARIKPGTRGGKPLAHIREPLAAVCGHCDDAVGEVTAAALRHVGGFLGKRFVLCSAEQRRAGGQLEFHDLLVRARKLLRHREHGPAVRRALRKRYQTLLLDEFQDTDPIQIELATLITSSDATQPAAAADPTGGGGTPACRDQRREVEPEPGRLFVVGDPKQSIYRFRRADIKTYLETRERFGADDRVELTVNFRSTKPVVDWVNTMFSKLIKRDAEHGQPDYVPLTAHRTETPPSGPSVALLGVDPIEDKLDADGLREIEAKQVAAAVAEILYGPEPWTVQDGPGGPWRPAREDDVCILLPARTSLSALERALQEQGVPYRAETASLVYSSREVRELMLALEAVADPSNELATVAALRSFVYGCGDDDLAHWRHGVGGRFSLFARIPDEAAAHPVAEGLAHLRELHDERLWTGPSELLDRLIRERGVLESAVAYRDPRAVWRRLRFVVDQARAWSDAGGSGLRAYLRWARLQGAESARVSETVLPESDDRSVRIMTIHGAKGLEFPIAVLSGLTTEIKNSQRGPAVVFPRDGSEALLNASAQAISEGYDEWQPIDEQMDFHERIRLLYVAATRARDHLIVSLVRKAKPERTLGTVLADAALVAADSAESVGEDGKPDPNDEGGRRDDEASKPQPLGGAVAWQPNPPPPGERPQPPETKRAPQPDQAGRAPQPDRASWAAERDQTLEAAGTPRVIAASSLSWRLRETDDQADRDDQAGQVGLEGRSVQEERSLRAGPDNYERAGQADYDQQVQARLFGQDGNPSDQAAGTDPASQDGQGSQAGSARLRPDPGLAKEARDLDLSPWKKGRGGTQLGRAVHGVLQDVDLASGDGVEEAAASQAMAEGIAWRSQTVADLVRQALRSPVAMAAAQAQHWREIWVAVPHSDLLAEGGSNAGPPATCDPGSSVPDGLLLEGYIDLLYRSPSGLVVVDWKTDQADDPAELKAKVEQRYRLQGAAYALAVGAATGEPVHEVVFVFLSESRTEAQEIRLANLQEAMAEVRDRAAELAVASAAVEPALELA